MITTIAIIFAVWAIGGSFLSKFVWIPFFQRKLDECPSFLNAQMLNAHERGAIPAEIICFVILVPFYFCQGFVRGIRKPRNPNNLPVKR